MNDLWPLSRELYLTILSDRISDSFVCKLIWERLDYKPSSDELERFYAGPNTPLYWSEKFPEAPQVIARRSASIHLTRSIPREYKQSLKNCLGFKGYKVEDLYPRRTRRATAVNWLLAWSLLRNDELIHEGPLPPLSAIPENPISGHPGDPKIE
ncbi:MULTISPECIES: DUF1823 family protein [unclassified Prochlorococcus]|uniref:DUF1823 family protein n=1 Tax=unclassified Prochlorococcus TaxID=2627481 RepID=UPI0005337722|nr:MULTISPECIES: DUF1823 family protein [unclassified Prochlorococcus]KGG16573.1 hypothetical protein EV06_0415 [Prochlorococcus sp. MIT 0602]KGG16952.1 hypothetical protein EV07_0379 [Prochlorococcus sp. MIT 0603]